MWGGGGKTISFGLGVCLVLGVGERMLLLFVGIGVCCIGYDNVSD